MRWLKGAKICLLPRPQFNLPSGGYRTCCHITTVSKMILDNNIDNFGASSELSLNRKEINYENLSKKFVCMKNDFKKQFAHIYAGRLNLMRQRLIQSCFSKWGDEFPIRKLSELSDECNDKSIVIGTIFKHQELKPSVLKEISEENQILPQPPRSTYISDKDQLILEDEIQRIRLIGQLDVKNLVTGVVIAVLGFENQEGKFEVEDFCFTGVSVRPEKPLHKNEDSHILMIGGLNLGKTENWFALELLIDWIKGELGSVSDQETEAKVCRIILAGDSINGSMSTQSNTIINTDIEDGMDTLKAVKQLDDILFELVQTIEIDVMPGEFDPSNYLLPQQAMYNCIFPKASQYESFHCVTNPYECNLEGVRILGTSGQPVKDIKSVSNLDDSLEILENTLYWGHMAPTAPDTLACYPYYNEDPFIITEHPDIYFAGNQNEFKTKLLNLNGSAVRLISIPSFSETHTCVLVNLSNLECTPLTFFCKSENENIQK